MFDTLLKVGQKVSFHVRLHGFDVHDYREGTIANIGREGDDFYFECEYPAGRVRYYECEILGKIKILS